MSGYYILHIRLCPDMLVRQFKDDVNKPFRDIFEQFNIAGLRVSWVLNKGRCAQLYHFSHIESDIDIMSVLIGFDRKFPGLRDAWREIELEKVSERKSLLSLVKVKTAP